MYLTPAGSCDATCPTPLVEVGEAVEGRACISGIGGPADSLFCASTGERQCACPQSTTGEGCTECAFNVESNGTIMRCTGLPAGAYTAAELGAAYVPGFSVVRRHCQGGRIQDVTRQGCNCRRGVGETDRTCAVCNIEKVATSTGTFAVVAGEGRQCLRCKLSTYFHLGQCLDASSIAQMESGGLVAYDAAGRSYGREFELPFQCTKQGRERSKSTTGEFCRCADNAHVADCRYELDSAGQTTSTTLKCRRSFYFNGTDCVRGDQCAASQTRYGDTYTNRACVDPFVCNQRTGLPAANGLACVCPDRRAGLCHWFADNTVSVSRSASTSVALTLTCQDNAAIFNNTCVDACPTGSTAFGSAAHTICL
jgi:hypothetical protein